MAVELTKVALRIETVDPGLPLDFFDAQIRCGDALLGVLELKVLEDGVSDLSLRKCLETKVDIYRVETAVSAIPMLLDVTHLIWHYAAVVAAHESC